MSDIAVGTNSWVTVAEADTYMNTRYGAWEVWEDGTNKPAALVTAYNQIVSSGFFSNLPSTVVQKMKDAQCEHALFLVMEGGDLLRRGGLQAQGVMEAGLIKEKYDTRARGKLAFPPVVLALLKDYSENDDGMFINDLNRDDSEDVA